MSGTPRTDALLETILDRAGQVGPRNCPEEWVTLCRKLESELKDARQIASKYDDRYFATRELLTVSTERAERLERELAETATEMQTLRAANAGLVEKVRRLEEAGDGLRKASRVFLLSFVDDDYGADDGTPIDRVDPDASVQWEDPPTAGEHVQLQNAINKWNQEKGQP